jgi:cytochrome c oxidase subunit 1
MLNERLGHSNFWLMFIGFNMIFFPMHVLGLHGMPRRIYTYGPETGWASLNALASAGALVLTLGVLLFLVNAVRSLRSGTVAGANPWGAATLEWATDSPPPIYNFHPLLTVSNRDPLWRDFEQQPRVFGVAAHKRQMLVTHVNDAAPDHLSSNPKPSAWPFWAALATTGLFIGSIFTPWAIPIGSVPVTATLIGWFWPKKDELPLPSEERRP